jgi:hypothetical protein
MNRWTILFISLILSIVTFIGEIVSQLANSLYLSASYRKNTSCNKLARI